MTHKLGVYYAPEHTRQEDLNYIEALQPPVIRILDPDVQQIADLHRRVPGAIIAPRTWVIDDHNGAAVRNLMADPVGTGRDHAEQYRNQWDRWQNEARQRHLTLPPVERVMFNAVNEPNQGGTPAKIAAYNVAFLNRCTELGIRAAALCLGPGWPDNTGPDTPVNWQPYAAAGLVEAIRRGNHWLELHEYAYKSGPQDGWRWLCGRHLQCPFDVPILLGEIGVDNYVDAERWQREGGNRGWIGNIGPEQYAAMIVHHIRHSDTRVVAALPFITDFRDNNWASFNTRPAHGALLARRHEMVPQEPFKAQPQPQPVTVHLPVVGNNGAPAQPQPRPEPQPVTSGALDPLVLEAIIKVESGGQAYGPDGRLLIRFEAHIFLARQGHNRFRHNTDKPWTGQQVLLDGWRDIHTGSQQDEYNAFAIARAANARAAYEAISMGLGQIMGFNAKRIGYPSAEAMYNAFARSETAQMLGIVNYVLSDPALVAAVRRRDWREIARLYNGPGDVGRVAPLLQQTYQQLRGA